MSDPIKAAPPDADALTEPFWQATKEGLLVLQKCQDCGYLLFPPSPICPECLSGDLAWEPVQPRGTVWSFATYHRRLGDTPISYSPYIVGLIQLNEGPRLVGVIEDGADLRVGSNVSGVFRWFDKAQRDLIIWTIQPGAVTPHSTL